MPENNRTTHLLKMPSEITNGRSIISYEVSISGEEVLTIKESIESGRSLMVRSSEPVTYREPLRFEEEINTEEWKRSLSYNESAIDDLLGNILVDFELDATGENMEWLKRQVDGLVSLYENKYDLHLPDATRSMVKNLIIRMAYDKLCIKNLAE